MHKYNSQDSSKLNACSSLQFFVNQQESGTHSATIPKRTVTKMQNEKI